MSKTHTLHTDATFNTQYQMGAYGLVFKKYKSQKIITHSNVLKHAYNSALAEIQGMIAAIDYVVSRQLIEDGDTINLYGDCQAINHFMTLEDSAYRKSHPELYIKLKALLITHELNLNFIHILSHGKERRTHLLPHTKHNTLCDQLAKSRFKSEIKSYSEEKRQSITEKIKHLSTSNEISLFNSKMNEYNFDFKEDVNAYQNNIKQIIDYLRIYTTQHSIGQYKKLIKSILHSCNKSLDRISLFADFDVLILFLIHSFVLKVKDGDHVKYGKGSILKDNRILEVIKND